MSPGGALVARGHSNLMRERRRVARPRLPWFSGPAPGVECGPCLETKCRSLKIRSGGSGTAGGERTVRGGGACWTNDNTRCFPLQNHMFPDLVALKKTTQIS